MRLRILEFLWVNELRSRSVVSKRCLHLKCQCGCRHEVALGLEKDTTFTFINFVPVVSFVFKDFLFCQNFILVLGLGLYEVV
jgi:hypothetical protein